MNAQPSIGPRVMRAKSVQSPAHFHQTVPMPSAKRTTSFAGMDVFCGRVVLTRNISRGAGAKSRMPDAAKRDRMGMVGQGMEQQPAVRNARQVSFQNPYVKASSPQTGISRPARLSCRPSELLQVLPVCPGPMGAKGVRERDSLQPITGRLRLASKCSWLLRQKKKPKSPKILISLNTFIKMSIFIFCSSHANRSKQDLLHPRREPTLLLCLGESPSICPWDGLRHGQHCCHFCAAFRHPHLDDDAH